MKHYKSVEFLSNFQCQAHCTNVKPPCWRFFGYGSVYDPDNAKK